MELETPRKKRVVCCKWPALSPGAVVRPQPELPLRAISKAITSAAEGVRVQNVEMSLTGIVSRDLAHVQRLCITVPVPHWMWHSGELAAFLIRDAALGEQALCLTQDA